LEKLAKAQADKLVSDRTDVIGAKNGLENLKQARMLLDEGIISGTGAEWLTGFGNFLSSRLGFKQFDDPIANTQAFAATMGTQVGQIIKQFGSGTGLSDADREYAEKIVGGKITMNEKAIRRLMNINEKAFKNVIQGYNEKAEQVMSKPGADTLLYDLRIDYDTSGNGGAGPVPDTATATNPETGEQVEWDGKQWVPKK
jgi:ribosomal protein S17E